MTGMTYAQWNERRRAIGRSVAHRRGHPIYRRLGFTDVCRVRGFE